MSEAGAGASLRWANRRSTQLASASPMWFASQRSDVPDATGEAVAPSESTPWTFRTNEARWYCSSARRVVHSSRASRTGFWSGIVGPHRSGRGGLHGDDEGVPNPGREDG